MGKALSLEDLQKRFDAVYNSKIKVLYYKNRRSNCELRCMICGHEWEIDGTSALKCRIVGCPKCNNKIPLTENAYYSNPKYCLHCNKLIEWVGYDTRNKKFCNQSCAASYNNPKKKRKQGQINYCINCGIQLKKTSKLYCCVKCKSECKYKQYIEQWKNNLVSGLSGKFSLNRYIRRYIFEKYNFKCSQCGWSEINVHSGKIPLEIDHIDGDYKNNKESNLRLLCPNCHSLTSTYRSLNNGNGRKERSLYNLK